MTTDCQTGTVTRDPDDKISPIEHALRTQQTFTREQVAWLMAEAMRWGYETRVDEENASYPPQRVFTLGKWFDQATERRKADASAHLSRPGDFKGAEAAPLRVAA